MRLAVLRRSLTVLAALTLLSPPAWASASAARARVGPNVVVNPAGLIDANSSPSVAANPRRAANLVVAQRIDRPRFSGRIEWTIDGGRTWMPTELPLPAGKDRPYAPDVAFGSDGTLYVLYANLEGTGNDPEALWLSSSRDGGRTLSAPVQVAGRYSFQARLAVDGPKTVYITWLQADAVGTLSIVGATRVVSVRSTDGGRSFSAPTQVSDPNRPRVGAASPVIDRPGHLVVLYEDFKNDTRDFQNLDGPAWDEPFALVVTSSSDDGRSFASGTEVDSGLVPGHRFLVYLPDFPSLATGANGDLVVAWADSRNGDDDVFVRRSTNGGRIWGQAERVNDNPKGDGTTQYLPRAAISPDGRLDIVFLDRRRDRADVMSDAWLASSSGPSRPFTNIRLSSESFDSRVGPSTTPYLGVDFGSRLGLVATGKTSVAAWTDSRLGNDDTGRQDIVSATVTFPSPRTNDHRVRTAVVVVVAIATGRALFALVSRRSRRRSAAV